MIPHALLIVRCGVPEYHEAAGICDKFGYGALRTDTLPRYSWGPFLREDTALLVY